MKPQLKSSPAARELIKRFEPFRGLSEQRPDGRWVVGYGHRAAAKPGVRVSEDEASLLLIYDVMQAEKEIDEIVSDPLDREQRDALVSFVHGVGVEAFRNSDVARYLYEGRWQAAGEAIAAHGETEVNRREAESALFMSAFAKADEPAGAPERPAPPTVELLIKIEHPDAEPEGEELAAAEMVATHPAGGETPPPVTEPEPVEEAAPPPPPPGPRFTPRRSAPAVAKIAASAVLTPPPAARTEPEPARQAAVASGGDVAELERPEPPADTVAEQDNGAEAEPGTEDATADKTPASEVIARMERQIGAAPTTVTESRRGVAQAESGEGEARIEGLVGFAFAGEMLARLPDMDETSGETADAVSDVAVGSEPPAPVLPDLVQDEAEAESAPETTPEDESELAPDMALSIEPLAETEATPEDGAAAGSADVTAENSVEESGEESGDEAEAAVEPPVLIAPADLAPPHPAETPALATGAVGEAGGHGEIDEAGDEEDGIDEDADVSPEDLGADVDPYAGADEAEISDYEGVFSFTVVLIAGLALTGLGAWDTWNNLDHYMGGDGPAWGPIGTVVGVFLSIGAAVSLIGSLVRKLRRKKG